MKAERRDVILDVAAAVLAERGYRDASMQEIARRASVSKQTLYAKFGDKRGLFEAVIRRNAQAVQAILLHHLEGDAPVDRVLTDFGCALLDWQFGDTRVAITRAAISEAPSDPGLAFALYEAGRDIPPTLMRFLETQRERGILSIEDLERAPEVFNGLLLGDTQTRRLLGLLPAPTKAQNAFRAALATSAFLQLYRA